MSELRLDPPRTFLPLVGRLRANPLKKGGTTLGIDLGEHESAEKGFTEQRPVIENGGETPSLPIGESHRYYGSSLHQGALPFITLNGMHITFSPFLLGILGLAIFSLTLNFFGFSDVNNVGLTTTLPSVQGEPVAWVVPLLTVMLLLAQLGGHLLSGWIFRTPPDSLVLSATGVIDPGLIFRERPVIHIPKLYETEHGMYLKGISKEDLEETNAQLNERFMSERRQEDGLAQSSQALTSEQEDIVQDEIRYITHAPLRAVGSSIGTLLFLWLILHSPLRNVIQSGTSLSELFWWYAAFLCISPFLPPHRLGSGFERQLTAALYPLVFFMGLLFTLPTDAQNSFLMALADPLPLLGFVGCVLVRKLWWYRIEAIARTVQEIPIERAMIPFGNMMLLSHGDSVHSAQQRALTRDQSIFPLVSGSRLLGYVTRGELMRPSRLEPEQNSISAVATDRVMLTDKNVSLEVCFSPKTSLPLFVIDEEKVIGLVSSESVRDALLLRLQEKFKPADDDIEW